MTEQGEGKQMNWFTKGEQMNWFTITKIYTPEKYEKKSSSTFKNKPKHRYFSSTLTHINCNYPGKPGNFNDFLLRIKQKLSTILVTES